MSLHFTRPCNHICLVILCLAIATAGCQKSKSKYFTIDSKASAKVYYNEGDRVLNICGESVQPVFARDVSCGEGSPRVDENFVIYIKRAINPAAPADKWFSINAHQNVGWNWKTGCLELTLTEDFVENTLGRGQFSMKVKTPRSDICVKENAFTVIARARADFQPDTASDAETNTPDSFSDTETTDAESTDSLRSPVDSETDHTSDVIDTSTSTEPPTNRTTLAWHLREEIIINGVLGKEWPSSDGIMLPNQLKHVIFAEENNEGEVTNRPLCSFDVMWGDALYIAVRCDDISDLEPTKDTLLRGDSVEIYIDASPLNPADSQFAHTVMRIGYKDNVGMTPFVPIWTSSPAIDAQVAMTSIGRKSYGFTVEIKIPWDSLTVPRPESGMEMGFDVGFNDWDNGSDRDFQLMWSGTTNNHYDSRDFGRVIFLPEPATDLVFIESSDGAHTGCDEPRTVTWENVDTYKNPVRTVNWNFNQTFTRDVCTPGDADVWFTVMMPAYTTVYFDVFNNRSFELEFRESLSTDCNTQDCELIVPEAGIRSIQNNTSSPADANIVVSMSDMRDDDISYITFRAVKMSK